MQSGTGQELSARSLLFLYLTSCPHSITNFLCSRPDSTMSHQSVNSSLIWQLDNHTIYYIIIIIITSFMQGIYTYVPETNCVPREYSVAAILLLLFMVLISLVSVLNPLYFYISTFRSMCAYYYYYYYHHHHHHQYF